ncbi:MAG: TetR/AcrR family transcriptional regulator [Lewinellaceae bacterium]|nr:TetR/AcrR family transcriptional regulator [Lewinellaceae bacterium]
MPVKKIDKQELLHRCWEVFNKHGYHGTSVSMLAEATGLGKSGLMHHHLSKESLMCAVLEYAQNTLRATVFSVVQEDLPPEQKLEKMLRRQNRLVKMERQGCFFANTGFGNGPRRTFQPTHSGYLGRMEKSGGWNLERHHVAGGGCRYRLSPAA